jgi:diadenosine tetraphosphatase ApaH/serine/threonine PP2A family protein phosphatase
VVGHPEQHQHGEGNAPLSSPSWFPRPDREGDIEMLQPSGAWTGGAVCDLLADPDGQEWRDKVGVAGPVDGSAKPTTRLFAARGWVLKTRLDVSFASSTEALEWLARMRSAGAAAGIWHPDKVWACMRAGERWLGLTICPELVTLRQLDRLADRLSAWSEMIELGIDVYSLHGVGLDLNPSNFGRERGHPGLFYLDEELYPTLDARNVAGVIASRLPEEPVGFGGGGGGAGGAWGGLGRPKWHEIEDELRLYPVAGRFEASRAALLAGMTGARTAPTVRSRRSGDELTCVIADVHANLPALEAVIADARGRGADEFLILGDVVGYGPHPAECIARLADLPGVVAIRGNHDHAVVTGRLDLGMKSVARVCAEWTRERLRADELSWLEALPTEHVAGRWVAVHGAPKDPHRFLAYVYDLTYEDNLRHLRELRIPICFYGHTHVQLTHVELAPGPSKLRGERSFVLDPRHTWLVNPGSVGQPRDGDPRAAYALWNRRTFALTTLRVEYDVERAARDLRAAGLPPQLEQRLRAGT